MSDARRDMRVRFWGTRGSVPAPGAQTVRYGGNTPCITVEADGEPAVVFDAGTGIRSLGLQLAERAPDDPIDLFLSHTHWDHIQGLPFFAPLFRSGARLRIWGSDDPPGALERTMRALMSPAVFPVPFESAGAAIEFRALPAEPIAIGSLTVQAIPVDHPGGAVGFRVATSDTALVYVPDNELRGGANRAGLLAACRDAGLLIHDSTYTDAESGEYAGWGHSTADEALALALEADVRMLALFHHAPTRSDSGVDDMVAHCARRAAAAGSSIRIVAAAEGEALTVSPDPER